MVPKREPLVSESIRRQQGCQLESRLPARQSASAPCGMPKWAQYGGVATNRHKWHRDANSGAETPQVAPRRRVSWATRGVQDARNDEGSHLGGCPLVCESLHNWQDDTRMRNRASAVKPDRDFEFLLGGRPPEARTGLLPSRKQPEATRHALPPALPQPTAETGWRSPFSAAPRLG